MKNVTMFYFKNNFPRECCQGIFPGGNSQGMLPTGTSQRMLLGNLPRENSQGMLKKC